MISVDFSQSLGKQYSRILLAVYENPFFTSGPIMVKLVKIPPFYR